MPSEELKEAKVEDHGRRHRARAMIASIRESFKNKKQSKSIKIELFRVQMRQMMIGPSWADSLVNDYHAHTNFRAVIEFEIEDEVLLEDNKEWALGNTYAAKGTVSGFITANVILQGLNVLEHKVMKSCYKKRTADTLESLFMYLAHDRRVAREPLLGTDNAKERRAAWGLTNKRGQAHALDVRQRYTYVLARKNKDRSEFQLVMALKTRCVGVDDIYAKHGTLADKDKYKVEAAGEMTIHYQADDDTFIICLDNDSGTFRPSIKHITRLKSLLDTVLKNDPSMKHYTWSVLVSSRPQLLPKKSDMCRKDLDALLSHYDRYMSNSVPQAAEQRQDIDHIQNSNSASDLGLEHT